MVGGNACPHCHGPLIEIDHYGERLVGCIECNRWNRRGSERMFVELPEEDLEALRALRWKRAGSGGPSLLLRGHPRV
jgi:hypothetical protein